MRSIFIPIAGAFALLSAGAMGADDGGVAADPAAGDATQSTTETWAGEDMATTSMTAAEDTAATATVEDRGTATNAPQGTGSSTGTEAASAPRGASDDDIQRIAAAPAPSQAQVNAARATCREHKLRVKRLENQVGGEDPALKQAYRTWEGHCAIAQAMMDRRAGRPVLQAALPSEDDTQLAGR